MQAELDSQLLCKPVAYPELAHSEDRVAPELHKPACARGECEAEVREADACYVREGAAAPPGTRTALRAYNPHARTPSRTAAQDCLKAKLAKVRGCATEFAQSDELITCRQYCKMPRKRNDGSEYTETELVYVKLTRKEFSAMMLTAVEARAPHRLWHSYGTRQRKLLIKALKASGSLELLAEKLGLSPEATMRALLSTEHPNHLTITTHDLGVYTDFAAIVRRSPRFPPSRHRAPTFRPFRSVCLQVKYENASSSTCDHPNHGTLCIAVVFHSPEKRRVEKIVTEAEHRPTGLESIGVSDTSKAPQHIKLGERVTVEESEQTVICDVFCGYSEERGCARFDQTLMRDIVCFYKFGHLRHATAASHRGKPVPIGQDLTSAGTSEYDRQRLERLEAARSKEKEEQERREKEEQERREAEAAAAAAEPEGAAPADEADGKKLHKRRKKATGAASSSSGVQVEVEVEEIDRRGKLTHMRMLIKFTDGCGVHYVQREAALGTAALYGDIELIAQQMADAVAKFGVIGRVASTLFTR